jgi:hypothetical protein
VLGRLQPRRLVAVDPDGEYSGWGELTDSPEVVAHRVALPEFRVRFRPAADRATAEKQFAWICDLGRWLVDPQPRQAPPASTAPIAFLVDELADLVGPTMREAPAGWQWLVGRGRKYGVTVLCASSRPEEIDKRLFNAASTLIVHAVNNGPTQRSLANALNVPVDQVRALSGHSFIARDRNTGKTVRG